MASTAQDQHDRAVARHDAAGEIHDAAGEAHDAAVFRRDERADRVYSEEPTRDYHTSPCGPFRAARAIVLTYIGGFLVIAGTVARILWNRQESGAAETATVEKASKERDVQIAREASARDALNETTAAALATKVEERYRSLESANARLEVGLGKLETKIDAVLREMPRKAP